MSRADRKPTARRAKGSGGYRYDTATGRHRWRITVGGKQYEVVDRDADRALARFKELKEKLGQGVKVEDGRQSLDQFCEYVLNRAMGGRDSTKLDRQKRIRSYISPALGGRRLCDLSTPEIRAWLVEIDALYARNSVKQALSLLKRILDIAVSDRLIPHNPAAPVSLSALPAATPAGFDDEDEQEGAGRPMTLQQVEAYLTAAGGESLELLFILALLLGLRRGEALGLRWRDYDRDNKRIRIRQAIAAVGGRGEVAPPKTKRGRRVLPLDDATAELLDRYRAAWLETKMRYRDKRHDEYDLIFCTRYGTPINPRNLLRTHYRIMARAGLEGFRFHDLRHTANQMLTDAGVGAKVRAAIMGHASVRITEDVYTHASHEAKRDAINRVGKRG